LRKVGENLNFREDYLFWRLTRLFISKYDYQVLQLSKSQKEIWLIHSKLRDAKVIRLFLHNLDWSNRMRQDMRLTLENGESIRKQLRKRSVEVLNIYVTSYPPVDDYGIYMKEPLLYPKGKKTKVTTVICDRYNGRENIEKILNESISIEWEAETTENDVERERKLVLSPLIEQTETEQSLFKNGKPFFTYFFIAVQMIVFILMELAGGSTNTAVLIEFGAKVNGLIVGGEWWRLLTPIILHIGFLHLLMNTFALYSLGMIVERIYGNLRFLLIYLAAGFFGTLTSLLFSPSISAGASGAIFGCFGALLYFGMVSPKLFMRTMGFNIFLVIGINLILGFSIPGIDNAGHIGGLLGGVLAAAIVHLPKKKKFLTQIPSLLFSLVLIWGCYHYISTDSGGLMDEQSVIILSQNYISNEEYDKAYNLLDQFSKEHEHTADIVFLLSYIEIKTERIQEAKDHLHKVIEMNPNYHEALYNLSLIYLSEGNYQTAAEYVNKAVDIEPENADYQRLLEKLIHVESAALEA
jgi:rhomboid protease GluP